MADLSVMEYAQLNELQHKKTEGWGSTTAIWVLVAAVIIIAIVYNWTKNCNEKVLFANGLSKLEGKISCIEPTVSKLDNISFRQNAELGGIFGRMETVNKYQDYAINRLNNRIFPEEIIVKGHHGHHDNHSGCDRDRRCGGRRFNERQTFILQKQRSL